jgi:hypothetical protein
MFEKIEMTPEMARKHILGSIGGDDEARVNLLDAIKTWANCYEADVSPEGNIWIAQPQRGHWLDDDRLVEFINWTEKQ